MKLYRGFKQRPKFYLSQSETELEILEQRSEILSKTTGLFEYFRAFKELPRLNELRRIAQPQYFTDQEQIARDFAGEKGFVLVIEIDETEALRHHRGQQHMAPNKHPILADNYLFSAKELADLAKSGLVELIELEFERDPELRLESSSELRNLK